MRTALLLATILASPVLASQVVWKWVDSQGVTHYSDRPVPGAQRIEMRGGSSSAAQQPSTSPPASASSPSASKEAAAAPSYRNLEIWKPGNDEVLFNIGGTVDVSVRVEPNLLPGHRLSLYLDGRLIEGQSADADQYSLTDVYRGTHQLLAVITDRTGKRVMESAPVVFHVRQTSTINPQGGRPINVPTR